MPLIKDGAVIDDPWCTLADDASVPEQGGLIVSLKRWQAERDELVALGRPLGVRLTSGEMIAPIVADLGHLSLIALEFPTFRDGRAYSKARMLREQHRFSGELRAVGNVLRDQLLFMHRCGFDSFEVGSDHAIDDWKAALAEFSVFYQPTEDGRMPAPWLRRMRRAAE